ncbi:MAG: (p)ppGpp synthetase, partial [Clostridia bacterium]|nr:(p)ppGpp synthetase [Clostridia bacterium]
EVSWEVEDDSMNFDAAITLIAEDRKTLISDISKMCLDMDIDINGLTMKKDHQHGLMNIDLTLSIANTSDIAKIFARLKQIKGVSDVFRAKA